MKIFATLYDRCIQWSKHRHANRYLAGLSFAEASFFPIPVDVMLAPMVMAKRDEAWRLAFLTTLFSVLGGLFGYAIGYFFFESIEAWLRETHYWASYEKSVAMMVEYGFWVTLLAGFSPIPYKIFTIAAGATGMLLAPFAAASIISRGARYYLVAALIKWGGPHIEKHLIQYIDRIGWGMVLLAVILWFVLR